MSYPFYKWLHIVSMIVVVISLTSLAVHIASGGTREGFRWRKATALLHGIGLFLGLVAGFGALAKMGMTDGLPGWVWAKIVIWMALGAMIAVIYRVQKYSAAMFWVTIGLTAAAAYLAIFKPF